jgi:hypothetical protein
MTRNDGKACALLVLLILLGLGLLGIPFFLTPPSFLEIVPRDPVFAADLAGKPLRVTEEASGNSLSTTVEKTAGGFLARVGRITSGAGSFSIEIPGYRPTTARVEAQPLHSVRVAVDLVPGFGRLEVSVVRATESDRPVAATLKAGGSTVNAQPKSVIVVELPPGKHRLMAEAAGYCSGERDVQVMARQVTRLTLPLSPDLTGNEIARFILGWGKEPRDLDAHFRKAGTFGYPNPAHVFFHNKEGHDGDDRLFASLDVDQRHSEGFETVTVYDPARGDYDYYVHRYAGSGTLGSSGATVEAFTRGCRVRRYTVPPPCAQEIWAVTRISVQPGRVDFHDQQRCEPAVPLEIGGNAPIGGDGGT